MRLNLIFKPCCIECEHVDVDVRTDIIKVLWDDDMDVVNVICSHAGVCRMYGDDANEPIANTDFGRRLK